MFFYFAARLHSTIFFLRNAETSNWIRSLQLSIFCLSRHFCSCIGSYNTHTHTRTHTHTHTFDIYQCIPQKRATNSNKANIFNKVKMKYETAVKKYLINWLITTITKKESICTINRNMVQHPTPTPFRKTVRRNGRRIFFQLTKKHLEKSATFCKLFYKNNLKISCFFFAWTI